MLTGTQAVLSGCVQIAGGGGWAKGGSTGPSGVPLSGGGSVQVLAGPPRVFFAPALAIAGSPLAVTVFGQPGDRVWMLAGGPAWRFVPGLGGVRLVLPPSLLSFAPQGVVPASGMLTFDAPLPGLLPGVANASPFLQGFVIDAQGAAHLASPLHPTVLDPSAAVADCNANGILDTCDLLSGSSIDCNANGLPDECEDDCNANGIADACDIAQGTSADLNGDGTPDECRPSGVTRHVDAAAAPGGDGSAAAPFRTIAEALDPSLPGDTILIADGLYLGPSNRGLDLGGRDVVVRSVNGPAQCVIDCQHAARAFWIHRGESAAAVIQGLTIRNGSASSGGGIEVESASPTIRACVFEGCVASLGGGLRLYQSSSLVRQCRFVANLGHEGGGLAMDHEGARIVACRFQGNVSNGFGGGVFVSGGGQASVVLSHCSLVDNHADARGGGIYYVGGQSVAALEVQESLLAGNSSPLGAALRFLGEVRITGSTITDQHGGVAILSSSSSMSPRLSISNSIVWESAPAFPIVIDLQGTTPLLQVDSCDVYQGLAGVQVAPGGTISWGAGNLASPPLFLDLIGPDGDPATAYDNDYRLGAGSPCVDAGDDTRLPSDPFDLDGDTIVNEPLPLDLAGAAREQDDPAVPDTGIGISPLVDIGAYEKAP